MCCCCHCCCVDGTAKGIAAVVVFVDDDGMKILVSYIFVHLRVRLWCIFSASSMDFLRCYYLIMIMVKWTFTFFAAICFIFHPAFNKQTNKNARKKRITDRFFSYHDIVHKMLCCGIFRHVFSMNLNSDSFCNSYFSYSNAMALKIVHFSCSHENGFAFCCCQRNKCHVNRIYYSKTKISAFAREHF